MSVPFKRAAEAEPVLRCEAIIPLFPRQWIWTYLLIKIMVVSVVVATMSMIAE